VERRPYDLRTAFTIRVSVPLPQPDDRIDDTEIESLTMIGGW
jgi:hypothetical protein